ncbi:acyltransferase family protein [Mucilaginibacter sp. HD30]
MDSQTTKLGRDSLIDNLKAFLIITVVVGHFIEPYIHQAAYFKVIFICIYSFHMPLFVFVSGYLSKSASLNASKTLTSTLIPYILFCLLWRLKDFVHSGVLNVDILSPSFHLWYLLSLFFWKIILPVLRIVKHYIIISFIISLTAGFSHVIGDTLSLSRTMALLPFFILGTVCQASTLYSIHKQKYLAFFGLLLLSVIIYISSHFDFSLNILFWMDPYHRIGYSNGAGFLLRATLMASALLIGVSIVVLTPSVSTRFTSLGSRTLTVYIFHGFLVASFARRFPLWHQNLWRDLVIIAFPIFLIFLLSRPVITRFYNSALGYLSVKLTNT